MVSRYLSGVIVIVYYLECDLSGTSLESWCHSEGNQPPMAELVRLIGFTTDGGRPSTDTPRFDSNKFPKYFAVGCYGVPVSTATATNKALNSYLS